MSDNSPDRVRTRRMDALTAMAFTGHAFEQRHPRETWPTWLRRCSVCGVSKNKEGLYIVSMAVTPKATNKGIAFFEVTVDPQTAETTVLIDQDPNEFAGEELQGF